MAVQRTVAVVLAVSVAGLVGGCASDECFRDGGMPCNACKSITEPAALQLGGGSTMTGFQEMQDGDEMTVVLGHSGLYQVTPSVRAWGVYPGEAGRLGNPDDPMISIELYLGTELLGGSVRDDHLGLTVTTDGAEVLDIWTPIYGTVDRSEYLDQLVTLRGEITDVCGNTATDELEVVFVR